MATRSSVESGFWMLDFCGGRVLASGPNASWCFSVIYRFCADRVPEGRVGVCGLSQSGCPPLPVNPTGCQRVELEYADCHNPVALLCLSTQPGARGWSTLVCDCILLLRDTAPLLRVHFSRGRLPRG